MAGGLVFSIRRHPVVPKILFEDFPTKFSNYLGASRPGNFCPTPTPEVDFSEHERSREQQLKNIKQSCRDCAN
jgi:hypothetical protein